MKRILYGRTINFLFCLLIFSINMLFAQTYKIVDTNQSVCYDSINEITAPNPGADFYGQDAQFAGYQPSYTDNGDSTITDNVTGLMWQKSADMDGDGDIDANDKVTYIGAVTGAASFNLGGYNDWRLPSIKELYSLILFSGIDPSGWSGTNTDLLTPFIDTTYFDFAYGDTNANERIIDAQYTSSTKYDTTTMVNDETAFGVNFADGRIKGYGLVLHGNDKTFYVKYVRGNTAYGINDFTDNGNGTVTDNATDLMWQKGDSQTGLNWQEALAWVQQKNTENFLGFNDWQLPNVKELQSIVDYTRAPRTTGSAAIDTIFVCSTIIDEGGGTNYAYYWSNTTHANMQNGGNAAYVSFGEALGWMEMPPFSGNYHLLDVHGAGAQRSDPKSGDPAAWPYGHGPQGDVIRIYNYVRLVRDAGTTNIDDSQSGASKFPHQFRLEQNYPNPFNPSTIISFSIPNEGNVLLKIFNILGQEVATLVNENLKAGNYQFEWQANSLPSGIYHYTLTKGSYSKTKKMILLR